MKLFLLTLALAFPIARPTIAAQLAADPPRPNVVLILTDDQGYGDLSSYGAPTIRTPRLDALGASGVRATQFYVASPVCSPSRAALLTGCYPRRVGMHEHVVFPPDDHGLHTDEETLADLLREAGYATGCFGKWHLGHRPGLLPTDQGFDVFAGVPYSNDMAQLHRRTTNKYEFRLPWMEGSQVAEWEPDQRFLTERTTDAAIGFIDANADRPFFAYVPYSMPHIPLFASEAFEGTSTRGLYGDVIEEIDANVGRILDALERNGVADDTLVLFLSDNGPWTAMKGKGGSAGPLRGGKGTVWEGGLRVPFLATWPARIPAGTISHELVTALDIVPTVCAVAGARLPRRTIDGHDAGEVLWNAGRSPTEAFLYFTKNGVPAGMRRGPWKLLLDSGELYHVEHDVSEERDVAEKFPDLVAELRALAEERFAAIEAEARPVRIVEDTVFDPRRE